MHPAIQRSNRFCAEYSRCKGDEKSRTLVWRGLVSEQDTTPYGQIMETTEILGDIKDSSEEKSQYSQTVLVAKEPKTKGCVDAAGHGSSP